MKIIKRFYVVTRSPNYALLPTLQFPYNLAFISLSVHTEKLSVLNEKFRFKTLVKKLIYGYVIIPVTTSGLYLYSRKARHQDFAAGGPKTTRGLHFYYNNGCMQDRGNRF